MLDGIRDRVLSVSILGLVDKGLRLDIRNGKYSDKNGFNPWFSG